MFTGIIECVGQIETITAEDGNVLFNISSSISNELKIDQSVAHNGVCLTVTAIHGQSHTVTAVSETLKKSNLGNLKIGSRINLERCLRLSDRLDGHMVQGHVDAVGQCTLTENLNGSWYYRFLYDRIYDELIVSKGSIAVNGVSLTVVDPSPGEFGVAIIPYTYEHTTFNQIDLGSTVNLEFDIIGKYILKRQKNRTIDH